MDDNQKEESVHFMAGNTLLEWEAPEYFHHEHGVDWYWWVGLSATVLLGLSIWQRSFLFAVLVALGWFTMVLYAIRAPKIINFLLTDRGLIAANKMYPWSELKSFWIFYNPPLQMEISVESKKTLMPYIKIPLGENVDPQEIKELAVKFIPEIEQQESLIDNISHLVRF